MADLGLMEKAVKRVKDVIIYIFQFKELKYVELNILTDH